MRVLTADEVPDHVQHWLWRDWIPCRCLTIVQGWDGTGKSTVVADLCARATTGRQMPGLMPSIPSRGGARDLVRRPSPSPIRWAVVIVSLEEPLSRIKSRLAAMGADLSYVRFLGEDHLPNDQAPRPFDIECDLQLVIDGWNDIRASWESRIAAPVPAGQREHHRLVGEIVAIDTLLRAAPHRDMRDYQQSDLALQPLLRMVQQRDRSVAIVVNHLDKQGRSGLGSAGIRALTRSIISCTPAASGIAHQFTAFTDRSSFGEVAALNYETVKRSGDIVVVTWGDPVVPPKSAKQRRAEQVARARDDILTLLRPEPLQWVDLQAAIPALDAIPTRCLHEARCQLRDEGEIGFRRIGSGPGSFTVWYLVGHESLARQMAANWPAAAAQAPPPPDPPEDNEPPLQMP